MRKIPDKKIVREIDELFNSAKNLAKANTTSAKKYVANARKLAKRNNISLKKYRRLFCHHCNSYFIPGENCSIRISRGKKAIKCLECNGYMRIKLS